MANVVSKWSRFMALGCSHAKFADPAALKAVIDFKKRWKPDTTVHLGDFIDTAAFRSGARGIDADSAEPVAPDIDTGLNFLNQLRPNVVLLGNHEDRLWTLRNSPNAVIAYASHKAIEHIETSITKLGAWIIPYDGMFQSYIRGDVTFLHGSLYSENAIRDHAESLGPGKIIHAHTHRAGQAPGRTLKSCMGYCVGTLTRRREMSYAKNRRATLGWSQGLVFGEIREGRSPASAVWLVTGPGEGTDMEWRLPI
jgi:hypothetical protein